MLLQRNIIYVLTIVAVVSILLAAAGVLVNVCSGLFSGAVIGLLTSLAQHKRIKAEYFVSLYSLLKDYYKLFKCDESLIKQSVEYLRSHSYDEIKACENFSDFDNLNSSLTERYSALQNGFNYREYVSLNPLARKLPELLKRLDHEMWFARGEMINYHARLFSLNRADNQGEVEQCISDRSLLYSALSSGVQCIYSCAEEIAERLDLADTIEYRSWLQSADGVVDETIDNEDWILYGDDVDMDEVDDYNDIFEY